MIEKIINLERMQFKIFISLFCLSIALAKAQKNDITSVLYETYGQYKELFLDKRRVKHHELQPLIAKLKTNNKFKVNLIGKSIQGRDISLISIGSGKTNVFLWSQMHGDEPTATQAFFDIFNFLNSPSFKNKKKDIFNNLTLHFLPMLNPDGAEVFQRRNALGIDVNRDALRLQSAEGKILKRVRDSLKADFGFNLHDQSKYYNVEHTDKPATISYLAPAYNYEKDIDEVRGNAMKVIIFMNDIIQKYAPGQVGRYNDNFEPRAFGDNIQKWGTSTILIESGGYLNDAEKQEIRKLNYVSILSALYTIAKGNYKDISLDKYENIPKNDIKLFDLKLEELTYKLLGHDYILDLGISQFEVDNEKHNDFYISSTIVDQGDLSTFYGYKTLNAKGYTAKAAKVYPKILKSMAAISELDTNALLKSGYAYIRIENLPLDIAISPIPINFISTDFKIPELNFKVGTNPTFLLEKNNSIRYAIINGFLIDLESDQNNFKNAMIFR